MSAKLRRECLMPVGYFLQKSANFFHFLPILLFPLFSPSFPLLSPCRHRFLQKTLIPSLRMMDGWSGEDGNSQDIELRFEKQSLAIIRSVSLRLQNEGQKKHSRIAQMHTESLTRIFFDLFLFSMHRDSKRICKRERLRLQRSQLVNF